MSGKGHSLVCCCSIAFALIPFSVHYLKGHRVRNKSLDRQLLICGCIGRIRCLYADIVCSGDKARDVAAGSGCPFRCIRLFILHFSRNAGELSVVVVCGCAVRRGGCRRVRRRLCRRRGQRDRGVSGRRSRHCDLRVAVACDRNSIHSCNTVICREIIAGICCIDHICHCSG